MAISLGLNIAALNAQRRLNESSRGLATASERLSSGLRINKSSDDAAGLAILSSLNANNRIYSQAIRNANDGVSALAIAEGTVGELGNILGRLDELTTQAANGSLGRTQRQSLQSEADALVNEHNRLVSSTTFNGRALFSRSNGPWSIQVGQGNLNVLSTDISGGMVRTAGTGHFTDVGSITGVSDTALSGDFNGDGNLDIVYINGGSSELTFKAGNGDGTFSSSKQTGFTAFSQGERVTTGDFNGDGKLDLIGLDSILLGTAISFGDGTGLFKSAVSYSDSALVVATGDFNGDGRSDVAFSKSSPGIYLRLGQANGTLGTATLIADPDGSRINGLSVGDIDGDGRVDLFAASNGGLGFSLISSGNGTFKTLSNTVAARFTATNASADYNRDGFADFGIWTGAVYSVALGNGDGTYRTTSISQQPSYVADFNNDGNIDILGSSTTFLNNGDGTFSTIASGMVSSMVGVGVFRSDGVVDIVDSAGGVSLADRTSNLTLQRLDLATRTSAAASLSTIELARSRVSKELSGLGSGQSRLASSLNTLAATRENYATAASRIGDVDVAVESANLLREQIRQQASAAILGQANQSPSLVLKLLQL